MSGNTKGGSIIVPLTSCLTRLDQSVLQIETKIVSRHTANSKPVKQEVNGTVILPPSSIPWLCCIHIPLPVCLSACLPVCLSISMYVYLSVNLIQVISTYVYFISLSLSVCLPLHVPDKQSISLSFNLSACPFLHLSFCLSASLPFLCAR